MAINCRTLAKLIFPVEFSTLFRNAVAGKLKKSVAKKKSEELLEEKKTFNAIYRMLHR